MMLIATAGHIDHGKTSLIRALTGKDTDRLPEERARGISIDLGLAYWQPDVGEVIGFVDVPGHERYVRNMLAGIAGVDVALIIVAADDGVMPQTIEHVQILDLLGIARGLVAITKCDRVAPDEIEVAKLQVAELIETTRFADAPMFEVSSMTGAGIDALGQALIAMRDTQAPRAVEGRNFRFAIDHVFTVSGAGTIATGTVLDGALAIGAPLIVSPQGRETRARGLQRAGAKVEAVTAGERCAINLPGIETSDLHRGDWLLSPAQHAPTTRMTVRLRALSNRSPVKHNAPIHLHLGAADLPARILSRRGETLAPGADHIVDLVLDQPAIAVTGQRFIIRDQSGRLLLGGGTVVDPLVSPGRRRWADRSAQVEALERSDPAERLAMLLALPEGVISASWFQQSQGLTEDAAESLYRAVGAIRVGKARDKLMAAERARLIGDEAIETLARYHREQPEAGGLSIRDLRQRLSRPVAADIFASLLRQLSDAQRIDIGGPLLRLPEHSAQFGAAEIRLWDNLQHWRERIGIRAIVAADLVRVLGAPEGMIRTMLFRRRINGDLWAVTDTRYLLRDDVSALVATAAHLVDSDPQGFTAAQFRDATGIGRNFIIQLLEFFDRIGATMRRGDRRVMRSDYTTIAGSAEPLTAPAVSG